MAGILFAIILEGMFAETVKCDAAKISCRDDAIRIDIIEKQRDSRAADLFDFVHRIKYRLKVW
jgi:hypothetical protein